jgi:hypothetical protein
VARPAKFSFVAELTTPSARNKVASQLPIDPRSHPSSARRGMLPLVLLLSHYRKSEG